MIIKELSVHNFRSFIDAKIKLENFSLLVGANNAGKSNLVDVIRAVYDDYKYNAQDFPKVDALDNESFVDIHFSLTDDEWAS